MPLEAGLTAGAHLIVTDADTAIALGSGDVPVLGTPRLVLGEDQTTVGVRVEVDHLTATAVGSLVEVAARLESIERRLLVFSVMAVEGDEVVARGIVHRAVVDRQRFLHDL